MFLADKKYMKTVTRKQAMQLFEKTNKIKVEFIKIKLYKSEKKEVLIEKIIKNFQEVEEAIIKQFKL